MFFSKGVIVLVPEPDVHDVRAASGFLRALELTIGKERTGSADAGDSA
jgi:hypothetical protein